MIYFTFQIALNSPDDVGKIRTGRLDVQETKLTALVYSRALSSGKFFRISVKVPDLDCFGDVVVQFRNCTLCLNLKSRPALLNNVDINQFIQLKSDFCLLKYYKIIFNIKQDWNEDYGNFEDAIFVVNTNVKLLQGRTSECDTHWQKLLSSNGSHFRFSKETDSDLFELIENVDKFKKMLADKSTNYKMSTQSDLMEFVRKVWNPRAMTLPGIFELSKLQKDLDDIPELSNSEEILSKLWFFSYQEKLIESTTKDEIMASRKISNADEQYSQLLKAIQDWFKNLNPSLSQVDSLLDDVVERESDC